MLALRLASSGGPFLCAAGCGHLCLVMVSAGPIWRSMEEKRRILTALLWGALVHLSFAIGVGLMVYHIFFGLTRSWGAVPFPFAVLANLALLAQFPLIHSFLLTQNGRKILALIGPDPRLGTTVYALIASLQLALVFAFWSPSGIVIWEAAGWAFWAMCALFAASWCYLGLAILQSGIQLQSGALGWLALLWDRAVQFPDMPSTGLYAVTRQPIYLGFALTLWTTPLWTADQLVLALVWSAYCVCAPRLKERRFTRIYGDRFRAYQARVPYFLPAPRKEKKHVATQPQ